MCVPITFTDFSDQNLAKKWPENDQPESYIEVWRCIRRVYMAACYRKDVIQGHHQSYIHNNFIEILLLNNMSYPICSWNC